MSKDLTETTPPMSPDHQALEELAKEAETPEDQAYLRDELRIINDDRDETGIPPVSVDDLPPVEDSDTREPIQDPKALHVDASGVVMTDEEFEEEKKRRETGEKPGYGSGGGGSRS